MGVRSLLAVVIASVIIALPAWAHHSHGNYNMGQYTVLKGTVKEVHWVNPHTWVYLEVADGKSEPTIWALEGASVVQLQRRGWTKEKLKAGDKISVRCHQLRDGSNGCLLGYITTADGVETIFD
jgi:hypothetical protein